MTPWQIKTPADVVTYLRQLLKHGELGMDDHESVEIAIGVLEGQPTTVDGPSLTLSRIPESDDVTHHCSNCGEERDVPHTWRECAEGLAKACRGMTSVATMLEHERDDAHGVIADTLALYESVLDLIEFSAKYLHDARLWERDAELKPRWSAIIRRGHEVADRVKVLTATDRAKPAPASADFAGFAAALRAHLTGVDSERRHLDELAEHVERVGRRLGR